MSSGVFVFTWSGSDSTPSAFEGKTIDCKLWFFLFLNRWGLCFIKSLDNSLNSLVSCLEGHDI